MPDARLVNGPLPSAEIGTGSSPSSVRSAVVCMQSAVAMLSAGSISSSLRSPAASPSAVRRFRHAVTDAALVEDAGRPLRAVAERSPQVTDDDAHQVGVGIFAPSPDPEEQRVEGHDASRVEREHAQQLVLGGREVDHLADRHAVLGAVDGDLFVHERLGRGAASERHQLGRRDGLGDVVGRTRLERLRDRFIAVVGGDEDDRQVGELGKLAHQPDAVAAGQHQIEQD